jgi:hypothetical protein
VVGAVEISLLLWPIYDAHYDVVKPVEVAESLGKKEW